MTTITASPPTSSSVATAARLGAFAIIFSTAFPLIYLISEQLNVPLFTFHPATNRIELGYGPPRSGEGPTMYWYGWTALSLIASAILGALGTTLPASVIRRIPLLLVWLLPILAMLPLAYALMPFWTK
jgi:hypothetical protein